MMTIIIFNDYKNQVENKKYDYLEFEIFFNFDNWWRPLINT